MAAESSLTVLMKSKQMRSGKLFEGDYLFRTLQAALLQIVCKIYVYPSSAKVPLVQTVETLKHLRFKKLYELLTYSGWVD